MRIDEITITAVAVSRRRHGLLFKAIKIGPVNIGLKFVFFFSVFFWRQKLAGDNKIHSTHLQNNDDVPDYTYYTLYVWV